MPDYSNAKIYKMYNDDAPNLIYYGSTVSPLCKRLWGHKTNFKCGDKKYTSRQLFEVSENVKIILVESFPCNSNEELLKRERFYIENNTCVNRQIPNRYKGEWFDINRTHVNTKNRENYIKNHTERRLKAKIYNDKHSEHNIERSSDYYKKNKDDINIRRRFKTTIFGNLCNLYNTF